MTAGDVQQALRSLASPAKAKASAWFFKTGPGQYGEGDQFIGVTVPEQRKVARQFRGLPLAEVERLVQSPIHEDRLTGLLILIDQFKKGDPTIRTEIYNFYLSHLDCVNNWDLVDSSAMQIVGEYLNGQRFSILKKLAQSHNLWHRRVAVLATFWSIKIGDPAPSFEIADLLMSDREDLIHKAVGWMLREIEKRCGAAVLESYLQTRYKTMPRTMLRYAIEHLSPEKRQRYLKGLV